MGFRADRVRGRWDYGKMDLASTHMVNNTLDFLQQQIKFIPQGANPPCIASLKPIKDFWTALKKVPKTKAGRQPASPLSSKESARKLPKFLL